MTLKEYELQEGNHFIAMEYFNLIWNRTFLVLLTEDHLIGLKVNGMISVETGGHTLTAAITSNLAIQDDLENPYSYIKGRYLEKIENLDLFGEEILKIEKGNFKIERKDIKSVSYDERKKWGMGYYPHDGKVYVKNEKTKKEFIILGAQSGQEIKNWIERF